MKGRVKKYFKYVNGELRSTESFYKSGESEWYATFQNWGIEFERIRTIGVDFEEVLYLNFNSKGMEQKRRTIHDLNGNLRKTETFNEKGELIHSLESILDKKRNVVKQIAANGHLVYEFEFDENGKQLIKRKYNVHGELLKTQISEYELNGNQISWKKFNNKGVLIKLVLSFYDSSDRIEKTISYYRPNLKFVDQKFYYKEITSFQDKNIVFKGLPMFNIDLDGKISEDEISIIFLESLVEFEYDKFGKLVIEEESVFRSDFSIVSLTSWRSEEFFYDERGRLIREESYQCHTDWDEGYITDYHYEYDTLGKVVKEVRSRGEGDIYSTIEFKYFENGNLFERKTFSRHETIEQYDDVGNIVYEKEDDNPAVEFIIEYYK